MTDHRREFTVLKPIRFAHCDPAGIVFYPQYFVLFNELVEDWFNEGLDLPYAATLIRARVGLPIVRLETDFLRPSEHGEKVVFWLAVEKVGGSSLGLQVGVRSQAGEARVSARQTLVFTSLDTHRAIAMPLEIRTRIEAWVGAGE